MLQVLLGALAATNLASAVEIPPTRSNSLDGNVVLIESSRVGPRRPISCET